MELARINAADVPDVGRVPAHLVNSSRGLRKIPPPVPVSPDSSPITPPEAIAGAVGTLMPLSAASSGPCTVDHTECGLEALYADAPCGQLARILLIGNSLDHSA
jgi:hypothetical protein